MNAKIKITPKSLKITPKQQNTKVGSCVFKIEFEVGGKPHTFTVQDAGKITDFDQFRAAVANHTGYLLEIKAEDWESELAGAWQPPELQPEGSEKEYAADNDDPPSGKEIEKLPEELRGIYDLCDEQEQDDRRRDDQDDDLDD